MISRRNFLKGLASAVAGVGVLPYLPKVAGIKAGAPSAEINSIVRIYDAHFESIVQFAHYNKVKPGMAVYVNPQTGELEPMQKDVALPVLGIYLGDGLVGRRGFVRLSAVLNSPYYVDG